MPIVHRVNVFVDGKLVETKDFGNRVSADQYADQRQQELDRLPASIKTEVNSVVA